MPSIQERGSIPAVINDSFTAPSAFPAVPEALKKRFPETGQWETDLTLWWKRTRRSMNELSQDSSAAVSQAQSNSATLRLVTAAGEASITTERILREEGDNILAGLINTVTVRLNDGDIGTAINALTVQAGPGGVLASEITTLTARLDTGDVATAIGSLQAFAGPGGVSATAITELTARLDTGDVATALNSLTTEVGPSGANATAITSISARLNSGDIATAITQLQVDVGPTGTLATQIAALVAGGSVHTYFQPTQPSAGADGDLWYDSDLDDRVFRYNAGTATWQEVSDARVAAVVTQASALATADGFLQGKYSLKVIAGNIVTGMNITSSTGLGTDISSIKFNAADFLIYNGSGTTGVPVFSASSGVVKLANTLTIDQAANKVYIGVGTWGHSNTPFYSDINGYFGLGNKLTYDAGTGNLTITAAVTITGGNGLTTGTAAADVNANATTINGGQITAASITASKLNVSTLSAITADVGVLTGGTIQFGSGINELIADATMLRYGGSAGLLVDVITGFLGNPTVTMSLNQPSSAAVILTSEDVGSGIGTKRSRMTLGAGTRFINIEWDNGTTPSGVQGRSNIEAGNFQAVGYPGDTTFTSANGATGFRTFRLTALGQLQWFPLGNTEDTVLYRQAAGELRTDGVFGAAHIGRYIGGSFKPVAWTSVVPNFGSVLTSQTFTVDISTFGMSTKPTAGIIESASDPDIVARYNYDDIGNTSASAVCTCTRRDGAAFSGPIRFSCFFGG